MVLRAGVLLVLIKDAGVKNRLDALIDQPLDMPMRQLGGVAFALRGDRFHAQLVDGARGQRREHHAETQPSQQRGPEGIVFVEIEHARHADFAHGRVRSLQRGVVEHAAQLVGGHVGSVLAGMLPAQPLFAAVARDMPPASVKEVDGEHAVIDAALAPRRGGAVAQRKDLGDGQHGGGLARVAFSRQQRRPERAHDAGDVRAYGLRAGQLLKGPEDRLVMEGAALHHHMLAQRLGAGELDDLEQRVFDHRAGQTRGDVLHGRALLLRLLDVGVHKHGAARAQIDGLGREERLCGKALRRIAHGHGEILQERSAAR